MEIVNTRRRAHLYFWRAVGLGFLMFVGGFVVLGGLLFVFKENFFYALGGPIAAYTLYLLYGIVIDNIENDIKSAEKTPENTYNEKIQETKELVNEAILE